MDDEMNEKELKDQVIKEFVNLQRVKNAEDRDAEITYQENVLKVRMQSLGIATESLELTRKQGNEAGKIYDVQSKHTKDKETGYEKI